MLRYGRLTDAQILARLLVVCEKESVEYVKDGLEAIVFTAQGDMRQASARQLWNSFLASNFEFSKKKTLLSVFSPLRTGPQQPAVNVARLSHGHGGQRVQGLR